jgi:hypothetical protein
MLTYVDFSLPFGCFLSLKGETGGGSDILAIKGPYDSIISLSRRYVQVQLKKSLKSGI